MAMSFVPSDKEKEWEERGRWKGRGGEGFTVCPSAILGNFHGKNEEGSSCVFSRFLGHLRIFSFLPSKNVLSNFWSAVFLIIRIVPPPPERATWGACPRVNNLFESEFVQNLRLKKVSILCN